MPHGHCYFWKPEIVWLMVVANALIALAYFTIPFTIFYFMKRRPDMPFNWVYGLFGLFIVFCGITHIMDIITIWKPMYRLDVMIRILTAFVSLGAGVYLIRLIPLALSIPSRKQMEDVNKELKSTEVNLKELTEELLDAQRIAHLGGWKFFPDEGTLQLSEEAYRILGIDPENAAEKLHVSKYIYPDDIRKLNEAMAEAISTGNEYVSNYRVIDRDGYLKHIYSKGKILYDDKGKVICVKGTLIDISEIKRHEDALEQSNVMLQNTNRELERSNKELEQFAYVASHDLQEPLRTIASYLQLLQLKHSDNLDEQAHEFLGYAVDGSMRMRELIRDLLDFSRLNVPTELERINMNEVIPTVLNNLKVAIEESAARVSIDKDLPVLTGSRSQITQLLNNLIINSIKFRGERPVQVSISAEDTGRAWKFSVADNGIGIDKAYSEKIFVVFQRLHTRDQYPGTGIGLAICKKIVELHGGEIWFDSERGQGTTFYFTIAKKR